MQFKFDANQEYQIKAVEAAVNLLEGQQRISGASVFIGMGDGQTALLPPEQRGQYLLSEILPGTIANTLNLTEDDLLANLSNVQKAHGVEPDSSLVFIEELIETAAGQKRARFPNFSIEMETGTGKTYVYLRTALELYRRYGLRKFIIVVPSIAIREGVLKTLQVTQTHMSELFGNASVTHIDESRKIKCGERHFVGALGVPYKVVTKAIELPYNIITKQWEASPILKTETRWCLLFMYLLGYNNS